MENPKELQPENSCRAFNSLWSTAQNQISETMMLKTISSSDLRAQIKRVLNEVGYGQTEYVVEKFGEPIVAIISVEDFQVWQTLKQRQTTVSLQKIINDIRTRNQPLDPVELNDLIEEARAEFYSTTPLP
jgi:prevent-host-death family protein